MARSSRGKNVVKWVFGSLPLVTLSILAWRNCRPDTLSLPDPRRSSPWSAHLNKPPYLATNPSPVHHKAAAVSLFSVSFPSSAIGTILSAHTHTGTYLLLFGAADREDTEQVQKEPNTISVCQLWHSKWIHAENIRTIMTVDLFNNCNNCKYNFKSWPIRHMQDEITPVSETPLTTATTVKDTYTTQWSQ